ncbi:MAG: hypothetical protein WCY26_11355 [Thiohalobacteraceae bacterium]
MNRIFESKHWSMRGFVLAALVGLSLSQPGLAADPSDSPPSLDGQIQDLKQEVLKLNRELFALEEELLYPASTQVSVFLSLDVGGTFALDSVQLKIDDKIVTNYLYTERELEAFRRGGVQRLYMGNLKAGRHEVVALFVGQGPAGRDYRRGANLALDKGVGPAYLELKITDKTSKQQPEFVIKEWE